MYLLYSLAAKPPTGGYFASRSFLVPFPAGLCSSISQLLPPAHRAAWPSGVPWPPICLTGVGVCHHGGQVPALAHVHRHVGSVLADDVAGLAGVHGIHLVAAAGPCGGESWGHCADSKFSMTLQLWKLKEV